MAELVLEVIRLNGFLRGKALRTVSCTSNYLRSVTRDDILKTDARDIIVRFLRRVITNNTPLFSTYYYRFYPRVHVNGMIQLISWKSKNKSIREFAQHIIESEPKPRRYHLACIVGMMDIDDLYNVGW